MAIESFKSSLVPRAHMAPALWGYLLLFICPFSDRSLGTPICHCMGQEKQQCVIRASRSLQPAASLRAAQTRRDMKRSCPGTGSPDSRRADPTDVSVPVRFFELMVPHSQKLLPGSHRNITYTSILHYMYVCVDMLTGNIPMQPLEHFPYVDSAEFKAKGISDRK